MAGKCQLLQCHARYGAWVTRVVDQLDVGLLVSQGSEVEVPKLLLESNVPSKHSVARPPRSTLEAPNRSVSQRVDGEDLKAVPPLENSVSTMALVGALLFQPLVISISSPF